MRFETQVIHAGRQANPATGAVMIPIYQTSTYKQNGVGKHRGYEYFRTANPTRATLEAGRYGLAYASGMAAIDNALRGQHLRGPVTEDELNYLKQAGKFTLGLLQQGAATLIEAFAKGLAGGS